ncbi:MAG: dihydroneopterin aldolase [Deltaproteobacteria bacterium]|nr:dihydroneopterin aldolase [Deltaproteobacteria bacterium]
MEIDAGGAADHEDLQQTWDYGALEREVTFVLQAGRFLLLETAARALLRMLLLPPPPTSPRPPATWASLRLSKPNALPGGVLARVAVESRAAEQSYTQEVKPWGSVDLIDQSRRLALYRLNLLPGAVLPRHFHRHTVESELTLTPGPLGRPRRRPRRPAARGPPPPLAPGSGSRLPQPLRPHRLDPLYRHAAV